jgi:Raf kinase inhibitor-like YbhB/YbcL family protein
VIDFNHAIFNYNIMILSSPNFENNTALPVDFTCDGKNINPALLISDVPRNAKSLTLIMDDPDAPSGDFVHWLLWNVDPKTTQITENSVPDGAFKGINSAGGTGYTSPCPPSGTHHYIFKLYALDDFLSLESGTNKEKLLKNMESHIVDQVELIALYSRQT